MSALPNSLPASTADTEDPRDPAQWKGLRGISEDEIDALAQAMVFFYHDTQNDRLRMHTIRDYIP